MLISACVPTYNSETTIRETILSLINQSNPFFKIKVYDNVSTDKTRDIIKELMIDNENLELLINEKNVGAEGNFTRCILGAEGDLCVIAHADDIYDFNFAKTNVDYFSLYPDLSATFCLANEIDNSSHVIGRRYIPRELSGSAFTKISKTQGVGLFYQYANFVTCPSVVVRSNVYKEQIKFWDGATYNTSADLDVWMRILETGALGFINEPLINYRVAEASYSYRVAKIRTDKHDVFKVLEAPKNELFAKEYKDDLNFLLNKDYAVRFLNTLRLKDTDKIKSFKWESRFSLNKTTKIGLHSFWHFKMMSAILGLRLIYIASRAL